ncbi:unnamed protein product, partial [Rotaria sp. Silwood1]
SKLTTPTIAMQSFVMFFLVFAALMTNRVHSLPAINFTDTELSNQMIKTLSEALLAQGEQQQQQPIRADPRGFYYPYPYQNVNWYNFPYLWPAVAGGLLDPTAPLAGVGAQLTGLGTSGCPTGFCPTGASCSQLAGQWQCGCGVNSCVGSKRFVYLFIHFY